MSNFGKCLERIDRIVELRVGTALERVDSRAPL